MPEVFFLQRPDPLDGGKANGAAFVDAFVGNPPFLGGTIISTTLGKPYLDWLELLIRGGGDRADLSAHFLRRTAGFLGSHGTLGFVTTNTISQGDTRSHGLKYLVQSEQFEIFYATSSMLWPGDASVCVSVVAVAKGRPGCLIRTRWLDEKPTRQINSRLKESPERPDPVSLRVNAGHCFSGTKIYGQGFLLAPDEREDLCAMRAAIARRISPYIGGEELNSSPAQMYERFVINFGRLSLLEAEQWPELLAIVRQRVKTERDSKHTEVANTPWWQFFRPRPELYESIRELPRCLANSQVSKHLAFAFQPTDRVFAHTLYVYPLCSFTALALLQSRIHEPWARLLSSSMKNDLRYAASDCFETFPFPKPDPRTVIPALESIGERLYTTRAQYMVDTNQGLTQTYNHLKDPACDEPRILALRTLHEDMDRAVLDAYGWSDLQVPPYCPKTPEGQRALEHFKDAVIDRLFALNAERAEEEKRLGIAASSKGAKPKGTAKKARKPKADVPDAQIDLGLKTKAGKRS